MDSFFTDIIGFIAESDFEYASVPVVYAAACALLATIFIIGAFSPRAGAADKTGIYFALAAFDAAVSLKTAVDAMNDNISDTVTTFLCIALLFKAACMALLVLLASQKAICKAIVKRREKAEKNAEKTIAEKLFVPFESSPFKRAEYLPTEKMYGKKTADYCINPSEIKKYIARVRERSPEIEDEDDLDKLEIDLDRFSGRDMTDSERMILTDRISRLIKLMTKYAVS